MLRFLAILSLCAIGANAACTLYYSSSAPAIFTRNFGSNQIILLNDPKSGSITIDDTITGYCSAGFRDYSYMEYTPYNQLTFFCDGNSVRYKSPDSSLAYSVTSGTMKCPAENTMTYYEARLSTCRNYGLQYGFFIGKYPVMIANVCFDLNLMRMKFVHYVAGARSQIVENQNNFNPGYVTNNSNQTIDVLFDSSSIQRENTSVINAIQTQMSNYAGVVQYQLENLIPIQFAASYLNMFASSFVNTNIAAFWRNLKYGNWKIVQDTIQNIAIDKSYDVFAGTSGAVSYPGSGNQLGNQQLTYKIDQYTRTVPLYIWNYVKEKNTSDIGVVIIGVNSPFYEVTDSNRKLCDDVCDQIPWMEKVNRVRKMTTLGQVFCCFPSDVSNKLDGFPVL